ncbi:MAG: hypothetical protein IJ504_00725 [Bacteroidales bacterium]|nr:hypothetical protein [Bacteroidales bacterium]
MRKQTRTIDGHEYRLFEIVVFKNSKDEKTITVAEEALNQKIDEMIDKGRYDEVRDIDDMYHYYVPQEIADDETEWEIVDSIESIMMEELQNR